MLMDAMLTHINKQIARQIHNLKNPWLGKHTIMQYSTNKHIKQSYNPNPNP